MISLPRGADKYRWQSSGFIQAMICKGERVHLWSEKYDTTRVWRSIHDHKFWFKSTVLVGQLNCVEYKVEEHPDGDYKLWSSVTKCLGPCFLIKVRDYTVNAGETYEFGGPGRYHDTLKGVDTMTHVTMTSIDGRYSNQFVLPFDAKPDHITAKEHAPTKEQMRDEVIRVYTSIIDDAATETILS